MYASSIQNTVHITYGGTLATADHALCQRESTIIDRLRRTILLFPGRMHGFDTAYEIINFQGSDGVSNQIQGKVLYFFKSHT